jgi:MFS superfamily sulfate permease-like transporter
MSSIDEQYEPAPYDPIAEARRNTVETIAGLFAAAALFSSLVALAYHPVPIAVGACLLALIASGMSVRHKTLCLAAVLVSGTCFVAGIVIAITTGHSLW